MAWATVDLAAPLNLSYLLWQWAALLVQLVSGIVWYSLLIFLSPLLVLMARAYRRAAPIADDAVVLITGATSGIGREIAVHIAARRQRVALVGRRAERLQEVAEECRAAGALRVWTLSADVRDEARLKRFVESIETTNRVDTLYANAGVAMHMLPADVDGLDRMQAVVDVNVRGTMNSVHAVLRPMLARRRGRIVVVSSLMSQVSAPLAQSYIASKTLQRLYVETMCEPLLAYGIYISHVAPGWVRSEMTADIVPGLPFIMPVWDCARSAKFILDEVDRESNNIAFPLAVANLTLLQQSSPPLVKQALSRATVAAMSMRQLSRLSEFVARVKVKAPPPTPS